MIVSADGFAAGARQLVSPNCDDRPPGTAISLVVLHGISLPPGEFGGNAVADFFCNRLDHDAHPYFRSLRGTRVSAHFFVRRDGALLQFVSCDKRAWHAGASRWRDREDCNDFSIGIELEGVDDAAYADEQYGVVIEVVRALQWRYPVRDVVGHCDIAPLRKTDPGPAFDWNRLRAGIA